MDEVTEATELSADRELEVITGLDDKRLLDEQHDVNHFWGALFSHMAILSAWHFGSCKGLSGF